MLRLSQENDVNDIVEILEAAKIRMAQSEIPQWQSGYPNEACVKVDIQASKSFVFEENGKIVATAVLDFEADPNYAVIENGTWLKDTINYASIHRIAIVESELGKGRGKQLLSSLLEYAKINDVETARIDTHELNTPMRKLVKSLGFDECGTIFIALENNSPRIAYEILL